MMPNVGDVVEWRTPVGRRWHGPCRVLHVADLGAHGHLVVVVLVLPDGGHDDWPHALWVDGTGVELRPIVGEPARQLTLELSS